MAARLGGDEFVLLLRADTVEEARLAVERVLRVIAQPYASIADADPVQVTASMGATVYPIDRSDPDTLLRHADHAMYGAKQAGRNGYLFFDPEHNRRAEERVHGPRPRAGSARPPRVRACTTSPRWTCAAAWCWASRRCCAGTTRSTASMPPVQFLPLIEHTGLSARVGDWVLSQALDQLDRWLRTGLDLSVSVNVSARHLQEPDFAQRLAELLARHHAPAGRTPRARGAGDCGAGRRGLHLDAAGALPRRSACASRSTTSAPAIPPSPTSSGCRCDVLKIDRSFVHNMLDDAQDRAIVEGVIGLARTFSCVVIAEGVETPAQARTLLEMGCDSRPGHGHRRADAGRRRAALGPRLQGPVRDRPAAGVAAPAANA